MSVPCRIGQPLTGCYYTFEGGYLSKSYWAWLGAAIIKSLFLWLLNEEGFNAADISEDVLPTLFKTV